MVFYQILALLIMSAIVNNSLTGTMLNLTIMWNELPYLKGWRLGFSLVYSNNKFENDAKSTRLNKALDI